MSARVLAALLAVAAVVAAFPREAEVFLDLGAWTGGLAVDPPRDQAYVALFGDGDVAVVSGQGGFLRRIAIGDQPSGVDYDPLRDHLYVGGFGASELVALRPGDGAVLWRTPLGGRPLDVVHDPVSGVVFVADQSGAVSSIEPLAGTVTGVASAGPTTHLEFDARTRAVYLAGPTIRMLNPLVGMVAVHVSSVGAWQVAAPAFSEFLYAAAFSLVRVHALTGAPEPYLPGFDQPAGAVAVGATSPAAYILGPVIHCGGWGDGYLRAIDPVRRVVLYSVDAGSCPGEVEVDDANGRVYAIGGRMLTIMPTV